MKQKVVIDAEITLPEVNKKMIADMQYLEPFGNENAQPLFYLKHVVQVQKPILMKDAHVKGMVFADGVIKPVVFFNRPHMFEALLAQDQEPFDLAVQITENYWNGNTNIELVGIDAAGLHKEKQ